LAQVVIHNADLTRFKLKFTDANGVDDRPWITFSQVQPTYTVTGKQAGFAALGHKGCLIELGVVCLSAACAQHYTNVEASRA
jgi:hypothetical protein